MASTSARMLRLLSLLEARRAWSGDDLAARLEVSARTLRRDIDALRTLGYPVHTSRGPGGGYQLGAGNTLPPLIFDDEQAVGVALALQTAPTSVFGLDEAVARALSTLTQVMPAPLRAQVESLRLTSIRNYWEFSAAPIAPEVLTAVGDAVRRHHVLRFDYRRADGTRPEPTDADFKPPRSVQPHHLALWAGRWYLVAYDPTEDAWPTLRIDRIHPLGPTGIPFTRRALPSGDVAGHVVTAHDRGDTPGHWPCRGSATMRLPADVVARWAPGGAAVESLPDGASRITLGAWSWAGVAGLLATFDTDLVDVAPTDLVEACHRLSRRMAAT